MRKFLFFSIMLMLACFAAMAQRTITGKVTDANGVPVPAASVQVKGTNTGTVSREDGAFSLTVPANSRTLVISAIGHGTREVTIGSQNVVNVTLQAGAEQNMQEVVVTGYGTQRRRDVTAAIGKVNPEPIATLVTPSVDKQLGGRTAGVQVVNTTGLVNATPRIRVRGVNSVSGGRGPLIVLDGIPIVDGGFSSVANTNALADINPADIETIDVLKDGAATAIYGSRGANGVLLITTKKGRNGRSNVTYFTTIGFSQPYKKFDLLNAEQFVQIANEKFRAAGIADQAFLNSERTNTDWQNYIYRESARAQNHTLSIDGGSERSSYYMSFNFTDQQGMVITNTVKRYAIRANLEHRVNNWLKVSNNITLSRTEDNDQNNGGNALSGAVAASLRALPNVRITNPNLQQFDFYNVTPDGAALGQDANLRPIENNYSNIAFVLNKNRFSSKKQRILNTTTAEIRPVNWISITSKLGIDYLTGTDFQGLDPRHGDGRGAAGSVFNQSLTNTRWVWQNYANLNRTFGSHDFGLTLGYEAQNEVFNSFSASGRQISDIFFLRENVIGGSYQTQLSSGSYSEGPGFLSYFARLNYNFRNRYYLSGTFRRDGLSRFAADRRFGNFPGLSASWRVSGEEFWTGRVAEVVNEMKLRASWGKVGNTEIAGGLFPYLSQYGSRPYGGVSGIAISLVGNSGLTWESNEKVDIGVDLSLLKNRINITADWFRNNNNGLVFAVPVPVSFGVPGNSIFQNIGSMENKGFELTVSAQVLNTGGFSWDLDLNYTNVKNKVQSLPNGQDIIGGYNILREGQPINALFGYRFAGVNSGNGNPMYLKADGTLIQGNIANTTYYNVVKEGDPTLGAQTTLAGGDRVVLGSVLPTYFGGVNSTMRFKGFSLEMLWRYSGGNKIFNLTEQEALVNQSFQNNGTKILERWTTAGQQTTVPRLWYGRDNFTNLQQNAVSRFVEDGDFVRLQNLQLSYGIDRNVLDRLTRGNVRSLRLFVQAQNMLLITKYTGIDPENISEGGIDNNTVPQPKIFSFGLSVGL